MPDIPLIDPSAAFKKAAKEERGKQASCCSRAGEYSDKVETAARDTVKYSLP